MYAYDANGNAETKFRAITCNPAGTPSYGFTYDHENRLLTVTGSASATFVGVYPKRQRRDGDGVRVRATVGAATTIFVGNYGVYPERQRREVIGSIVTKYYYVGGQRIAMRTNGGQPQWLVGDHLGSTSKVANGVYPERFLRRDGTLHSQQLYYP